MKTVLIVIILIWLAVGQVIIIKRIPVITPPVVNKGEVQSLFYSMCKSRRELNRFLTTYVIVKLNEHEAEILNNDIRKLRNDVDKIALYLNVIACEAK